MEPEIVKNYALHIQRLKAKISFVEKYERGKASSK